MIDQEIRDETAPLKVVVLGLADDFGHRPSLEDLYDPKSKWHLKNGTFPTQASVSYEMSLFEKVLKKHNVQVLRPEPLPGVNQIYARDIGFVIDKKFIVPNVIEQRKKETIGLEQIIQRLDPTNIVEVTEGVRIEGGDVMPWMDKIFVGYSEREDFDRFMVSRTNLEGVNFLKNLFPHRQVHAFELVKSDDDPMQNALHLDCCFQPIGTDQAIIYKGGFKQEADYNLLVDYFGEDHIIEISNEEMYHMNSNIFSISPKVIVSSPSFKRLNKELRDRGFMVDEVEYDEISKMEGLFRCSTLPLVREYD